MGQRLAKTLLNRSDVNIEELALVDVIKPIAPNNDSRVRCVEMDLRDLKRAEKYHFSKPKRFFI